MAKWQSGKVAKLGKTWQSHKISMKDMKSRTWQQELGGGGGEEVMGERMEGI